MIRKAQDRVHFTKEMFGGPGSIDARQILNAGEFYETGRLFNQIVLKPGVGIGTHRHNKECEVYCILSGTATYNDNGTEVQVSAGDVTICWSGEQHGILNTGSEDLEMIALIFFDKR